MLIEWNAESNSDKEIDTVFKQLQQWMDSRKLKLNVEKTEALNILTGRHTTRENLSSLTMNGKEIKIEEKVRSLGVVLDNKLTLTQQISHTKKKAMFNLINISRISNFIDRNSRLKLVHGLVLSHLDFCNVLYYGLPNKELRQLQVIINMAARVVTGMPRYSRERITPLNISLHFLPIKARIYFKICLLTYKALNHGEPRYLAELLVPENPQRALRSSCNTRLQEPIIASTAYSDRCFKYCAPRLYNALSTDLKNAPNVEIFKKKLKTELFTRAYNMENLAVEPEFFV